MKITRDIIDNGRQIVHVNLTEADVKKAMKKAKKADAMRKAREASSIEDLPLPEPSAQ